MSDYISREAAEVAFCNYMGATSGRVALMAENIFSPIPAADVAPVVRCDACDWHVDVGYHYCNKWCQPCPDNADFFCAYGERHNCGAKTDGGDGE